MEQTWANDPVVGALIVVSVLIGIICLPRIIELAGYLFGGLLRWKLTAQLARSVSLSRDRDLLCFASILPLCLVSSRFKVYDIAPMDGQPAWVVILMSAGVFIFFILFRMALVKTFLPQNMADAWKISRTNLPNGIIVLAILTSATAILLSALKVDDAVVRSVILHEVAIVFLIILYRNFEILSWNGQRFKAFLYLCGLELLPALLLVISAIIF